MIAKLSTKINQVRMKTYGWLDRSLMIGETKSLYSKRNKGLTFFFSYCAIQCSAWNNCLKHELHCYFDIYCWQSWKYVSHMKMHLCLDLFKSYTHKVTEKFIFAVNSHIAVNSGGPRAQAASLVVAAFQSTHYKLSISMHWTNILNELQKIKQSKFVHYENYR